MASTGYNTVSRTSTGLKDSATSKTPQSPTATSTILPGPNPGDRLAGYFDKFFATIIGISTLGASITFSKMVSAPVQPWRNYGYDEITVQYFMAVAWLLFIIALILTSLFASLLSLYRPQAIEAFATRNHHNKKKTMWAATLVSMLLVGLVLTSFIFLSLITVAYVGPVGWTALAITSLFGLIGMGGIIWQSPMEWPNWMLKLLPRTGQDEVGPNRQNIGFGIDGMPGASTWPIYGKNTYTNPLRKVSMRKAPPLGTGSNLTGGILPSSLRQKRSYTDFKQESEQMNPPRMEESFSSEKEWEAFRSAGGHPMRIQPRVSWPREGVVSSQQSPPPRRNSQDPAPTRGQREWKHDRRERLLSRQGQSQTESTAIEPQATHRISLPPPVYEEQEHEQTPLDEEEEGYDEIQSELSSISQQRYEPLLPLHHQARQVYRTVPPTRRGGGYRPVWELEEDRRQQRYSAMSQV